MMATARNASVTTITTTSAIGSSPALPCPLLRPPPPDRTDDRSVLRCLHDVGRVGQEERPVGRIPPPLAANEEAFAETVVVGQRRFLQALGHAAELTAVVAQVLGSRRERRLPRQPLTRVNRAARDVVVRDRSRVGRDAVR